MVGVGNEGACIELIETCRRCQSVLDTRKKQRVETTTVISSSTQLGSFFRENIESLSFNQVFIEVRARVRTHSINTDQLLFL